MSIQSITIGQSRKAARLLKAGKFQEAIDYNLAKVEKAKNPIKYHQTLARAHALMGDDIQSENQFKKALEYVDQKPKQKLRLRDFDVMDELALLSVRIGNWQQARELITKSLEQRVKWWKKNDPVNFRPYLPLGMLYFANGLTDSAKYYLNTYKDNLKNSNYTGHLDVDKYADVFQVLADISIDENNFEGALRLSKKSLRLQSHIWTKKEAGKNYADRIRALNSMTYIYSKIGKYGKAKKTSEKVEGMLEGVRGNKLLRVDAYLNRSLLEYKEGNITISKELLIGAMQFQIEFVRNTMIYLSEYEKENIYTQFKTNSNRILSLVYSMSNSKHIQGDDLLLIETLNYIINTKAIILSETNKIRINAASSSVDSISMSLRRWKQLKQQWHYLTSVAKKRSRDKVIEIHKEIVTVEKELSKKFDTKPIINWESIQTEMGENEMAIEMAKISITDTTDSFMIFKVTSDAKTPQIIHLSSDMSVKRSIEYYANAIKYDVEDTLTYTNVWRPLQIPKRIEKVYLSASGDFHLINFNTLKTPEGEFLINRHNIVNVTNIASLTKVDLIAKKLESAVLMGVSDFSEWRGSKYYTDYLSDLPGVESEIYQIDSLLRRNGIVTSVGLNNKATEKLLVETKDFSILHLASHGFTDVNNSNPMLSSGVILRTTDTMNDGLLSAYEASLLNLDKTQLVVLSACGSGLGKISDGEGVYGLQRAFEVAGVNNIIMSMWNIDDSFTQFFMSTFYNNLIKSEDVPRAFGETLMEAMNNDSNPRLWGAFKLVQCY